MEKIDISGQVFSRLTVIERASERDKWICKCECGTKKAIFKGNLVRGKARSCGCLHSEELSAANKTHGMSASKTYAVWMHMKGRCENPNNNEYKNYGARGIKVCERWGSFDNFLADMGERPFGLSIERKDNDAGYNPDNCKWATSTEQTRNRRNNVKLTVGEETMVISDWARRLGTTGSVISSRIKNGWSLADACTTPLIKKAGA